MRKILFVCLALALVLGAAAGASAGTVYVPVALDGQLDGDHYRTAIWATNTGGQVRRFAARFVAADVSGIGGDLGPVVEVPPGQTRRVTLDHGHGVGMVEIVGGAGMVFSARVESVSPSGAVRSLADVPVVDATHALPARSTADLLGLGRAPGTATHLGVTNLGDVDADCTIRAHRAGGGQIAGTATVEVPARGQRYFADAFAILGESEVADARFAVSCPVPFYAFAALSSGQPRAVEVVTPSAAAARGLAAPAPPAGGDVPPGGGGNGGGGNGGGGNGGGGNGGGNGGAASGTLLSQPGTFFTASTANGIAEIDLPIARGQRYRSLHVEFDLFVPKLRPPRGSGVIFWGTAILLRPVKGGTYFAHTIRGNGRNKSILDMGREHWLARGEDGAWQEGATHRVVIDYDTAANRMTWQVFRAGRLIERLTHKLHNRAIVHNGEGLKLIFGLGKVYDGAYFPPYGFRFSNLEVRGQA